LEKIQTQKTSIMASVFVFCFEITESDYYFHRVLFFSHVSFITYLFLGCGGSISGKAVSSGTTVDLTTPKVVAMSLDFAKSPAYAWLQANAHKYGFVLSYPKQNQYYQFEPWHWRFVGVELATKLHNENKFFYDLDQHEIDVYLIKIFDL
jgi:hypothetical protein